MTVWVVFVDADARRDYDEDIICASKEEARDHMRELRAMGFDQPVFKVYAEEGDYYDAKDKR